MKKFNINGLCMPAKHYMVDLSQRVQEIDHTLVELGEYFTINRGRQYGKTTTLRALEHYLSSKYIVIKISFEGLDDSILRDTTEFIRSFILTCASQLARSAVDDNIINNWKADAEKFNLLILRDRITKLVCACNKPVVLMIDEVDKSSDNQLFLSFLGMLRDKYLTRASYSDDEHEATFKSVVLAGVYNIKNLKLKIRPDDKHTYNSPWNIAAPFDIDMSFSADEIAEMLKEYETDHHTGMDVQSVSHAIHDQTSGYPYLVSAICKKIDERTHDWTVSGVQNVVYQMLLETNTLFDDIIKNLENNESFRALVEGILLRGERVSFVPSDPNISLGLMFGILKRDGLSVSVSNRIFEQYIYNHMISVMRTKYRIPASETSPSQYAHNGVLDMSQVLSRFSLLMKTEYRKRDARFVEENARLLFLIFLTPIINGTGHYAVEVQTRDDMRMDIAVFYGKDEFIVELKLWHGEKLEHDAYDQITKYLDAKGKRKGYLLVFCGNKIRQPERGKWVNHNGYEIYEVIVPFLEET
ncbi:hypothetical protein AGMMS49992_00650 [Clostridia bacterium]|nr:hypothetical protein AGMMS49992_00650 [Clostridia bacterium]